MTYSYKTVDIKLSNEKNVDDAVLNELGADGWKLVSFIALNSGIGVRHVFMKENSTIQVL